MPGRNDGVRLEGFREFRRDLRKLQPEVDKQLRKDLRVAAKKVANEAGAHEHRGTGRYARSIRPYITARGVSIGSNLPQAGVLHFGGTIRPKGVPIVFQPRPVVSEALDRNTDRIVDSVGDAVEAAARKAGWH